MKKLTNKEKEIMDLYWKHGPMFVKELLEHYDEPRPHFNTLSTLVRILEKNGLEVMQLLTQLNQEGTTVLMVTHSERDAGYAQRIVNLFDGQVVPKVRL